MVSALAEQLRPDHIPTDEDLRKEAEASLDTNVTVEEDPDDPRGEVEYPFELSYIDARGKVWRGSFVDKILTIGDRQLVELARARCHGGMSMESFSQEAVERNLMLAHLLYSLVKKPKWAETLRDLHDPGILRAIYGHAAEHEDFFLGWGSTSQSGKTEG